MKILLSRVFEGALHVSLDGNIEYINKYFANIHGFEPDVLLDEILVARNGVEAIEMCKNNPDIDIILMDIKMPYKNGHEATREIRDFNKDVIVIAQTAHTLHGYETKIIESGCNDYISKPISKEKLFKLIKGLVKRK